MLIAAQTKNVISPLTATVAISTSRLCMIFPSQNLHVPGIAPPETVLGGCQGRLKLIFPDKLSGTYNCRL